jgi:hypothetical protein
LVQARLVVVHLIFSYWAAILRPPLSAIFWRRPTDRPKIRPNFEMVRPQSL